MYIRKLDIRGFGRITNKTLDLTRGMNIIYGNNEAGKSTLQMFIKGMLYGLKGGRASKDGTLPPMKKYKPWSGDDFGGSMEYELDDGAVYRVGRNFANPSVRVFDFLFNDITGTFENNREKGVLFAEKQLGLNETAFEKTVFIRQMETRIGEEGSRELLSRLTNVRETGFEDISFKRAAEVLRDALKSHVGTEKTTTRPLDKVNIRLEELLGMRKEAAERRSSLHQLENELAILVQERDRLEQEASALEKGEAYGALLKNYQEHTRHSRELSDTVRLLEACEEEQRHVEGRLKEFEIIKEEIGFFSSFEEDAVEVIHKEYNQLQSCIAQAKRIEQEMDRKLGEIEELERQITPVKAFGEEQCDVEEYASNLKNDLDRLKKEYARSNMEMLNEKIKSVRDSERFMKYNILVAVILSAVFLIMGFSRYPISIGIGGVSAVATVALVFLTAKRSKRLSELLKQKKMSFIYTTSLIEEINRKQRDLDELFSKVGAGSFEEFLRLKVFYDHKIEHMAAQNKEINRLEGEYLSNRQKAAALKNTILDKLSIAGIADAGELQKASRDTALEGIKEEYIKSFSYGVNRYKGIEPSISYSRKRLEDIQSNIQALLMKASSAVGREKPSREDIMGELENGQANRIILLEKLEESLRDIKANFTCREEEADIVAALTECNWERVEAADLGAVLLQIHEQHNKARQDLNLVLLKVKENETLLKASGDDEKLQRIDEEIAELEVKKAELEEKNSSLRAALELLTEASAEIRRDFAPALNERLSSTIGKLTANKYQDLRADDQLGLKVIAPETGEVVSSTLLSGGTVDQMYLALRLSCAELIGSAGEKLPFIMDEVLSQYDDERTRQALGYFKELSSCRQLILFTCKSREIEIAREIFGSGFNLIELD